ncbi:chromate resistance protein ChrB domain-containing protein [Methylibium sp.]|uniref:chromate resistance protein ChrB domain-containing protein n=1 Tax=Methylibium sp. TaxID=2067992 RepID=UPI00286AD8ED|nr:chromate resistance protein ChrB domain-containing protein [Methylibium sp.]
MTYRSGSSWLLIVLSLPTQSATARMRIWRALKSLGCAALRDGAYLLPASSEHQSSLQELADECVRETGSAWVMSVVPATAADADSYEPLFDRSEDYAALVKGWKESASDLSSLGAAELTRLQRKLRRDYDALRAIDFFPGDASAEAQAAWTDFSKRLDRVLSPDEPQDTEGQIPRLDASEYQGRLWATRRKLWVDRAASAWLIHRFIDPEARFQWLAKPSDCPRKALGFDFDGATFTHVGERVTFETLLASFGLDEDPALIRMGAMVHALDVGGEPVPEASGFEAMLAGARERLPDDDALLAEISSVLDSLYTHFQRAKNKGSAK